MTLRTLVALLRPIARAMGWVPFLAAGGFGLAIVAVPAATSVRLSAEDLVTCLRIVALTGALGAAFLLDDPAAPTVAVVPTSRLTRYALRVGIALPVWGLWWAATLWVTASGAEDGIGTTLPLRGLSVEAGAIFAIGLAVAGLALRRRTDSIGGVFAAPTLLIVVAALSFLPARVALFVVPGDPRWPASHDRWAALLAVAAVVSFWSGREPATRPRWPRRRSGGTAARPAAAALPNRPPVSRR